MIPRVVVGGSGDAESAGEVDFEEVECPFPAPGAGAEITASFVADVAGGEAQQLQRGLVGREVAAGLGDLAELEVDRLHEIGIGYDIFGRFGPVAAGNLGLGWSGSGRLEESARAGRSTP